ncbi:glycosyltransferase family 4 protein [Patescibacteria group bacterium]|nr:glycosyltransferase family 4 protein [Patescibacteria group bacterium]
MKKRILIFSTAYYPFVGGAEVAVKEITDRLTDYQFEMVTALMDKKLLPQEKIGRIMVNRVGVGVPKVDKLYLASRGYKKGLLLHKKNNYQAVWAVMASYGGFAALSFKLKTGIPYFLTLQEGDSFEYISQRVAWFKNRFKKIFTKADGLQAISNHLYQWGKKMGFSGEFSEVVPNGVDVNIFTKDYPQTEIQKIRQSFGFPDKTIVIVTASRLVEKNGIEYVIKALKQLPENICFYICGVGELEERLKNITKRLSLEKRVVFTGYKDHQELSKIFKASDIFIRPSLSEGLGNAFLEAMATGLVTIGTLVGGIPDFLEDGITGLVCKPQDPDNIAQVIKRASKMNQEEKNKLHENVMKIINARYNWEYISSRMDYLFKTIIS